MSTLNNYNETIDVSDVVNSRFEKYNSNEKQGPMKWIDLRKRLTIAIIRSKMIKTPPNFPYKLDLSVDLVKKAIQLFNFSLQMKK